MLASLTTGVSGLRTHQLLLEVVGNNLANVNTSAFKASRVLFSDVLSETLQPAMGASGTQGGTNPVQRGLGVKVASIDVDDSQGSLEMTGRNLDLAIRGDGFFVVNDGSQDLYTRVGTFTIDTEGKLVHSSTGYRVMDRYGQEILIPSNSRLPGNPTSTVDVTGNLDAGASPPQTEELTTDDPFEAGGLAATAATQLNALDSNLTAYVDGDTIAVLGITADGDSVSSAFTYGAANDGTTLGELQAFIDALYDDADCVMDAAGNLVLTAQSEGPASLALNINDGAGATGDTQWDNHLFGETTSGADGTTWQSSITVFDTQGMTHILGLTFEKKANNIWDLTASIEEDGVTVVDGKVEGLRFNEDGSFAQIAGVGEGDAGITLDIAGLGQHEIDIDFGSAGGFDGLTQFGGSFSAVPAGQDGYEAGTLSATSVRQDGVIQGTFTNGLVSDIATLQVATFPNPQGLLSLGDGFLARTPNSGLPSPGQGGTSGAGTIRSGAIEGSNVDVAYEFTRLIIAQRGFQVNARTIGTTDEVLEELANLVR